MKKIYGVLLFLTCTFMLLNGCSSSQEQQTNPNDNLELLENQKTYEPERAIQTEKEVFFDTSALVDTSPIDLTGLDSLMAYGAVYETVLNPQEYFGRELKIQGIYYAEYYESTGEYYHYVVVSDEQACCKQGLEFVLTGEHTYPDDYPANETAIVIDGTFGYYEIGQSKVSCLLADNIQIV